MPDETEHDEAVKVVDRRRFTSEGERRPNADTSPVPEPPAPLPSPPPAASPPESEAAQSARQAYDRQGPPRDYKVDFEALVMSLSTSAMYQLGLVEDPARGPVPANLEAARHTIDILGVIQEKTRGNLATNEQRLLEQVLYELRLAYISVTGGPPPAAPPPGKSR